MTFGVGRSEGSGKHHGAIPTVAAIYDGADTRRTGEHLKAGALEAGMWFDLNSAGDADPVPVRVTEVAPSHRPERIWVEFVSSSGDIGEAHLVADDLVAIMASYDFEEEEW